MKTIKWKVVQVDVSKIKPTPNNYKLKTEDGSARFNTSVESYGLAGSVILNADFTLIDGNTRLEKAKEMKLKKIDASMPDRKLTPKEFKEFSAMYDMARAGEVDILRIKNELGDTGSFFKKWGFELPEGALKKFTDLEANENVVTPKEKEAKKLESEIETARITLLFTTTQAEEFIRLAESMYKALKVDNVTDFSITAARKLKKLI